MSNEHRDEIPRCQSAYGDGWSDNLQPLEPLDVMQPKSFDEMVRALGKTSFGGRNMSEATDVLHEMVSDPKCFVVATFSGAMTVAKMGLLITEMIEQGMVNAIVSTGALMCHGMIEQTGHTHFRYDPKWGDKRLYEAGYARVYDTLELESNLDDAEAIIVEVLRETGPDKPFGSWELNRWLGEFLGEKYEGRGILQAAAKHDVPVYVPAFSDSELGIDLYLYNLLASKRERQLIRFDPLRDLDDYYNRAIKAERVGIFTIGGGVPRNWAQQVGPLAEIMHRRSGGDLGGLVRFRYGVRICPEPVHWGGLSGCTYSEGVSWGKFVPPEEGGRFAEVYADATTVWPFVLRAVLERLGRIS